MSTQTRRILIKVDTSNSRQIDDISKKLGLLNNNTKSLAGGMRVLSSAFSGWLAFLGVGELTRMSDQMQNLDNRLKIITGSAEGAREAFSQLQQIADRTNQGLASTGEVYARLANSLKRAKASTSEVGALTESLVNTFRIAGATTTETTNTIIQLSQAFSSGELRGQELRSVMEQNATLAGLLQERFKGDVYKKAQDGLIKVSDVLKVLAENQKEVNAQAKILAPTFEQVLVKSMDRVSVAIGKLNKDYELSSKFALIMKVATDNLGNALIILGGAAIAVGATKLPVLITALQALWGVMLKFVLANPITATLTALGVLATVVYTNWDRLGKLFDKIRANFYEFQASIQGGFLKVNKFLAGNDKMSQLGVRLNEEAILDSLRKARDIRSQIAKSDMEAVRAKEADQDKTQKELESLIKKLEILEKTRVKQVKVKDLIGDLNEAFLKGGMSIEEYSSKLNQLNIKKLTESAEKGSTDIFKFHEQLRDLNIQELNKKFSEGAIDIKEYGASIDTEKFKVLNEQMKVGLITTQQYNNELLKLESKFSESSPLTTGINNYIESVGTLGENIAKGVERTLGALEDGVVKFVKTGKFQFKDFANAVIDEIIRIQVRMAIAGLIGQVTSAFTSSVSPSSSSASGIGGNYNSGATLGNNYSFANGGIMTSRGAMPLHKYASGGIARSPQLAMFGEGRMPEAYVPLPNGRSIPVEMSGGSGATNVVVNVNVESGKTETRSDSADAERLGILISSAVKKEIVNQKRSGGLLA